MQTRHRQSEIIVAIAGKALAALFVLAAAFCTLFGTASQYSNLDRIIRIALSVLRWVIPVVAQGHLCQAGAPPQHLLLFVASVWPVFCFIAR
jgi:uncharacterized membrane protein